MEPISKAINNHLSPVYNSTNWKEIKDYLSQQGVVVSKKQIIRYLEKQQISSVKYKNEGLQKISAFSKPYVMRSRFFSVLHCDTFFLSKKRKYKAKSSNVLVVICQLSRFLFLENPLSMKFVHQKPAWENIFAKVKGVYPEAKISVVVSDQGIEFGLKLRSWFKSLGIKLNNVNRRPFRLSRGSPYAESCIRRVRANLEKEIIRNSERQKFPEILQNTENVCNNQLLSSIGMSASVALQHKPDFIAMKSETLKQKRKKYLKKDSGKISIFSIVKIKKFQEKEFKSVRKESYGVLSPCFMVWTILKDRPLPSYRLANLFTLSILPGSYSREELVLTQLSYLDACKLEERNITKIVKKKDNLVEYSIAACDRIFVAHKDLIKS